MLNVMDDVTPECLAAAADMSISGVRVARELARLVVVHGKPTTIVSENGTELTSNAVLSWADDTGIDWHYIAMARAFHALADFMPSVSADETSREPAEWATRA